MVIVAPLVNNEIRNTRLPFPRGFTLGQRFYIFQIAVVFDVYMIMTRYHLPKQKVKVWESDIF